MSAAGPQWTRRLAHRQGDDRRGDTKSLFFLQAEDGIRDLTVTGVQTCALPISTDTVTASITGAQTGIAVVSNAATTLVVSGIASPQVAGTTSSIRVEARDAAGNIEIGRASCRERV